MQKYSENSGQGQEEVDWPRKAPLPSFRHFGKDDQQTPQSSVLARPNNAMAVTRIAYTMVGHGLLPLPSCRLSGKKDDKKSLVRPSDRRREEGRKDGIAARSLSSLSAAVCVSLSLQGPLSTAAAAAARMRGRRRSGARSECGDVKADEAERIKERKEL